MPGTVPPSGEDVANSRETTPSFLSKVTVSHNSNKCPPLPLKYSCHVSELNPVYCPVSWCLLPTTHAGPASPLTSTGCFFYFGFSDDQSVLLSSPELIASLFPGALMGKVIHFTP